MSNTEKQEVALESLEKRILEILTPVERVCGGFTGFGKYCATIHTQLCRFVMIGMSQKAAAIAAGITPATLRRWLQLYPKLMADLETARELANAQAMILLQRLMQGDGHTAFQAIRLFLTTHSEDFRERSEMNVNVSRADSDQFDRMIHDLYGVKIDVRPNDEPPGLPAEGHRVPGALPVGELGTTGGREKLYVQSQTDSAGLEAEPDADFHVGWQNAKPRTDGESPAAS